MLSWPKLQASSLEAATTPTVCPVIVEKPGTGMVCLSPDEAQRLSLESGSLWFSDGSSAESAHQRMAPRRLLAAGIKLDINRANIQELMALPEIGEGLARAIIDGRERRTAPLACQQDLECIPGLGTKRVARMMPFIQPLPQTCSKLPKDRLFLPHPAGKSPAGPR